MSFLLFLVMASLSASPPSSTDAGGCPVAEPGQVEYVRLFFATDMTRPFREQHGLLGISPGDIRLLTDDTDAEACRRMVQAVTLDQAGPYPKVWRGFRAGDDFYVMMVIRELPPGVFYHGGGTGLIVLNAEMEVVAAAS